MSVRVPLATNSYRSRSLPLSAQRMINLYAEQAPADARSPVVLFGAPGLRGFATVGAGPIRALHVMGDVLYAVSGDAVYRVGPDGAATLLGPLAGRARTGGRVDAADNGRQLVLVNVGGGGRATVYDAEAGTLAAVTDVDFPRASSVTYLDGYHIFSRPGTGQFFISDLLEATSYEALDFATAESAPDPLVRVFVDHRELWAFGSRSIEIWTHTGASDFPFERLAGTILERGCGAGGSVAKMDNSVFWLGDDRVVYRANGYQPARVSTHAIEYALGGYATVEDATAWTYSQEGHNFYCLTFPSAPASWVYDAATGLWHERESRTAAGRSLGRWRVACGAAAYGAVIVGDYETGQLYRLALDARDEAGIALRREAVSAPLSANGARLTLARLEVEAETGIGLAVGQGEQPQIMVQWSDDGGRSWSSEHWATLGAVGAYRRRCRFYRLGQFRERVLRLVISDPVAVAVLGAVAELDRGQA